MTQVEIEIIKKEKSKVKIDVTFPFYVQYGDIFDSGGGYDCYACIDESLTSYTLTEYFDDEWRYEVGRIGRETLGKMATPKNYDYEPGCYRYELISADKFYEKVAELRAALDSIPEPPK